MGPGLSNPVPFSVNISVHILQMKHMSDLKNKKNKKPNTRDKSKHMVYPAYVIYLFTYLLFTCKYILVSCDYYYLLYLYFDT